ncbi:VIT1/CCC1 transporter family protein [Candidatus Parvarchaeota archaeon]|nr:VIT1/CCC1 transporter family protein [Candidatus Parvarchaeota archaeon]
MKESKVIEDLFRQENKHHQVYSTLLFTENNRAFKARLSKIADIERKHCDIWAEILKEYGKEVKYKNYYLLPYLFVLIRRLFGRRILAALLSVYEKNSIDKFLSVISYIPRKRLKKVVNVISDELYNESIYGPEVDGGIFSHIREVVFGMNDGLVEVLAAVAGIVGIYHDNLITALAGLIIGISGTLSMGVGAYLSSRSAKDVYTAENKRIWLELEAAKRRVLERSSLSFDHSKNILRDLDLLIKRLRAKRDPFYTILEKEKTKYLLRTLGEKNSLEANKATNPFKDGLYVGVFYLLGAVIPLVSFFAGVILHDSVFLNLIISVIATSLAISLVATIIAVGTSENVLKRISQSLFLSLMAATATFLIGSIVSHYIGALF